MTTVDIEALLQRMTLEEKCAQLGGVWFSDLFTAGQFDEAKMQQLLGDGIGQVARYLRHRLRTGRRGGGSRAHPALPGRGPAPRLGIPGAAPRNRPD